MKNIIQRCTNPNNTSYKNYGARGITICNEWKSDYLRFRSWAYANGYAPELSIERIDNNKGYEPGNCKFSTKREQACNRRSNLPITAFGETKLALEWSKDPRCAVEYGTLRERIKKGWSPEKALQTAATPPGETFRYRKTRNGRMEI